MNNSLVLITPSLTILRDYSRIDIGGPDLSRSARSAGILGETFFVGTYVSVGKVDSTFLSRINAERRMRPKRTITGSRPSFQWSPYKYHYEAENRVKSRFFPHKAMKGRSAFFNKSAYQSKHHQLSEFQSIKTSFMREKDFIVEKMKIYNAHQGDKKRVESILSPLIEPGS